MLAVDKESPPGETAGLGDAQVDGVHDHDAADGHGPDAKVSEAGELVVPLNGWPGGDGKLLCLWLLLGKATRDPRLSKGDIAALYAIAQHANNENIAWPRLDTLAACTGVNRSTVIRSVDRLVKYGYLLRASGKINRSNRYNLAYRGDATSRSQATSRMGATSRTDATPKVASTPLSIVAPTPPDSVLKNLFKESTHKHMAACGNRKPKVTQIIVPTWVPEEAWANWDEYRRERSPKGWTHASQKKSLQTLEKLRNDGHDPAHVINCAIECGWVGLHPPPTSSRQRGSPPKPSAHTGFDTIDYQQDAAAWNSN